MPVSNSIVERVVFKECNELASLGLDPVLDRLSQCVMRLGSLDEVDAALDRWRQREDAVSQATHRGRFGTG